MTPQEDRVAAYLRGLEIRFDPYQHPPIATAEEGERHLE